VTILQKTKSVALAVLLDTIINPTNKHSYEKRDFHSVMNKQEIVAPKAELSEVSEKIDLVNEKIDLVNDKMDKLMMMNEKIDLVNEKIDSLIHMVNTIDFVMVDAKSNFAKSSYKFVLPSDDLLGLLEPEVPAVSSQPEDPEVTILRV
jgi:hypothetical protein